MALLAALLTFFNKLWNLARVDVFSLHSVNIYFCNFVLKARQYLQIETINKNVLFAWFF